MTAKLPLWDHQKKAIEKAQAMDHFALFFEQGTGKTATTIHILADKFKAAGQILPTLILCPLIVVPNWKKEFEMHSDIPMERIILLQGTGKKRLADAIDAGFRFKNQCIYVVNYEALLSTYLFNFFRDHAPKVLVCDESHRVKTYNAKRTKLVTQLAERAAYRYLLSGTPVLSSAMDLFSQFRILDGGCAFTKNFFIFRAKYFYDLNHRMPQHLHFPKWVLKPRADRMINKIVNDNGMTVKKSECLDLPELVKQKVYVDLSPDQSRMYQEMFKDFIAYIDGQAVVAELAITKALRLLQIVSGYVKTVEGDDLSLSATPRMQALRDLLEVTTPDHKVLVWAVFKENYRQIQKVCEELELPYVEVHGGVSAKEKHEAVEKFNNDPAIRVFIGHPGSGGIGINLVSASYSIFFSRNFSLEQDQQAEARNYRAGSERHEKITRIDLVAPGTIDELVLEALAKKQTLGEDLISNIRKLR